MKALGKLELYTVTYNKKVRVILILYGIEFLHSDQ
jgi:hypothetical protein